MKVNNIDMTKEAPIVLRIPVIKQSLLYKLLIKLKAIKSYRDFAISALSLGTVSKISKLLLEIEPVDTSTDAKLLQANYELLIEHKKTFATIIALAVVNRRKHPAKRLINFFLNNLSTNEIMQALQIVQKQMNLLAFMQTIVMLRGVNIMKSDPQKD